MEDLLHSPAVRIGLQMIAGLRDATAKRITEAPDQQPLSSADDLARQAQVEVHEMKLLAAADALMSLAGHRRQQVWDEAALLAAPALLRDAPVDEDMLELPAAPAGEEVVFDYASLGLTLRSTR